MCELQREHEDVHQSGRGDPAFGEAAQQQPTQHHVGVVRRFIRPGLQLAKKILSRLKKSIALIVIFL